MKKEESLIEAVVRYSIILLKLKNLKKHTTACTNYSKSIGVVLHSTNKAFEEINKELDSRIREVENVISNLQEKLPFFKNRPIVGISKLELILGYVENENPTYKQVMFLTDYSDKKFQIKAGEVKQFNEVTSIIGNQKGRISNVPKVEDIFKGSPLISILKK